MSQTPPQYHQHIDDLTQILKSAHARAVDLADALGIELILDLDVFLELACELELAGRHDLVVDLVRDLELELAHRPDLTNLESVHSRFVELLTVLTKKAEHLDLAHEEGELGNHPAAPGRQPAKPVRAAGRVTGIAARVLPATHQARYGGEYQSELHDIAATGASWWQQVAYAIRLLNLSWELRHELRRPAARRS